MTTACSIHSFYIIFLLPDSLWYFLFHPAWKTVNNPITTSGKSRMCWQQVHTHSCFKSRGFYLTQNLLNLKFRGEYILWTLFSIVPFSSKSYIGNQILCSQMGEMQEKSWDLVNGDNFDGLIYWRWSSPGGSKNTLSISNSSNKGNPHFNLFPVQSKESSAYSSFEEVSPHPMMELYYATKSILNTRW